MTIAWTHSRHRARQTLVAIAGVHRVGFSMQIAVTRRHLTRRGVTYRSG